MAVTIKKNVDVQGTLEAKQFKYQVKRDLSGDVQFTNMSANPAALTFISASTASPTNTRTGNNVAENDGWNFIKPPKIRIYATGSAFRSATTGRLTGYVTAWFSINNVAKETLSASDSCSTIMANSCSVTISTTKTPAPVSLTSAQASPNNIRIKGRVRGDWSGGSGWFTAWTIDNQNQPQKNQKYTVMK